MQSTFRNLVIILATSGAIKSWQPGEVVGTSDLNANFSHIHSKMVGGHGARLVNADVAANANISASKIDFSLYITNAQVSADAGISPSKIQYGGGIAKAFAAVYGACSTATCTMNNPYNMTSITRSGTGVYRATWNFTATNTPAVTISDNVSGVACTGGTPTSTFVDITCVDLDTPAATDSAFTITVHEKI